MVEISYADKTVLDFITNGIPVNKIPLHDKKLSHYAVRNAVKRLKENGLIHSTPFKGGMHRIVTEAEVSVRKPPPEPDYDGAPLTDEQKAYLKAHRGEPRSALARALGIPKVELNFILIGGRQNCRIYTSQEFLNNITEGEAISDGPGKEEAL